MPLARNLHTKKLMVQFPLSQTVQTEEAMEKLGLHTIGKKEKLLAKVDELSGMCGNSRVC